MTSARFLLVTAALIASAAKKSSNALTTESPLPHRRLIRSRWPGSRLENLFLCNTGQRKYGLARDNSYLSAVEKKHENEPAKDSNEVTNDHEETKEKNTFQKLSPRAERLQSRLLKSLRDVSLRYDMISPNDRIMTCISGGKDSATLLHLFLHLQSKLAPTNTHFEVVAVHLNQMQPGYDNKILIEWLDSLGVPYRIVTEDTYSIVTEKTPSNKAYCSLCSRLRRGILYTIAHELNCNKIALGHHGDDAMETLLLNMVHGGLMKGMPARYYSSARDMHVIRPLITCLESDIAEFAKEMRFPILPCNLCGSQEDLHRGKAKLLCDAMQTMSPNARKNVITAMGNVKPSHLLDENLRVACGLDGITGTVMDEERSLLIGEKKVETSKNGITLGGERKDGVGSIENVEIHQPSSFIESLL